MVSVGGPEDTVTWTVEFSVAVPVGVQEMTVPDFTVVELAWAQADWRWAALRAAATAGQSPVMAARDGTGTGGGPEDSTTDTVLPCFSTVPAPGIWRMISPVPTVVEKRRPATRRWSLSARRADVAAAGVSPVMVGNRWPGTKILVRAAA